MELYDAYMERNLLIYKICDNLQTFLKMAGLGRAGPKKGTSSRAVTDT